MGYFPFFMEIEDKKGVVLGGGQVAARKVEKLLPFGPRLICIAPVICARIESLAQGADQLTLIYREACREDMEGACFVIAATDREDVNAWAAQWCRERQIPVNVVDDREKCTFFFPALVQEGALTIEIMGGQRERVLSEVVDQKERAACLEKLFVFCREKAFQVKEEQVEAYMDQLLAERRGYWAEEKE